MPTYLIDRIDFKNPATPAITDLQYPRYLSLIDYDGIVTDHVRQSLQVEPAFQFLDPKDEDYEFVLELADSSNARFASDGAGPIFKEAVGRPVVTNPKVTFDLQSDRRICKVTLNPTKWTTTGPEIIVLRIFCNRSRSRNSGYDPLDGVSITFIKPGATPMTGTEALPRPPVFDLAVIGIEMIGSFLTPVYAIFSPAAPLSGVSIEPVFRVSPARPNADVRVTLRDEQLTFPPMLPEFTRDTSGLRPAELSRLLATNKRLDFSWTGGALPAPKKFGFHVPVLVQPQDLQRQEMATLPYQPKTYVDPILFHDPPMG